MVDFSQLLQSKPFVVDVAIKSDGLKHCFLWEDCFHSFQCCRYIFGITFKVKTNEILFNVK